MNDQPGGRALDHLGLIALVLLMVCTALHFDTSRLFVYYREAFAVAFAALTAWYLATRTSFLRGELWVDSIVAYLLLFPALLVLFALVDPGVNLYSETATDASGLLVNANLKLYVLRNALLYVPMVLYFSLRGLSRSELRVVASAIVAVSPISLLLYLRSENLEVASALFLFADVGANQVVAYNSYVPFLTFPMVAGLYLLLERTSLLLKVLVFGCVALVGAFILLSTSRQSILFVLLAAASLYYHSGRRPGTERVVAMVLIAGAGVAVFMAVAERLELTSIYLSRFGSREGVFRSDRLDVLVEGIRLLNPVQFLSGAGLTSVIVSGPHNDYVRWTQRVGLFAMFLGFAPFVIAFWRSFRKMREPHEGTPTWAFLNAGVAFTLFHSLFGYPREDAFQAPYAFLGLALWLGVIGTAEGDSASSAEPRTPLGERARPDTELDDPMGDG